MKQQSKLTRDDLSRIPKPKPWARILERGKYALMLLIAVLIVTNATEVKAAVPEAAKAISGTGIFRDKIFWLNWDLNGNATNGDNISSGTTRSWTSPSGIVYKATITSLTGSIVSDYANGWSGNNIIGVYDFATGITPAIKTATGGGTATFTMTVTATLPNGTIITKNNFVIAGAESLSKSSEYYQLSVPTTSKPLKLLETYIKGGNFSNFNIDITVSNNGNTLYATNLAGGDSRGDVLIGAEQVENVTVTLKGEGLQSIAIGIFEEMDFGDADNSYETNSTNTIDYARHIAVSSYSGGVLANGTIKLSGTSAKTPNSNIATLQSPVLTLGASIDTEEAKKTSASGKANGDDNDNIDDEDGLISFLLSSNQGVFYAKNSTGKMAYCHIWIDENKNGKFDANEYIKVDVPYGTNGNLTFNPSSIGSFYSGTYYTVRLRLTTMSTLTPYGVAIDGEVEDHIVTVVHSFDDIIQTPMNIPVSGNLLINDKITDKVVKPTFNGVTIPLNTETTLSKDGVTYGKITIAEDGSYTFKPETSFVGIVPPITYTGRNSTVNLDDNANLIITVVEPYSTNSNNPPIANYDTGTVKQGQSVTVKPLANDSDPDGDAISVTNIIGRNSTGGALTLTSTPQNVYDANNVLAGQASIVSGELVFTAAATYKGEVPFTYSISDGKGGTSSSTINVTVTSTDTPTIVANDDAKAKPQGQTITGTVKDNDTWSGTNPKVTTATVTIGGTTTTLTPGTQTTISGVGKITLNSDGTYTFIPAPTFVGTVPVTYTVKNDAGVEDTATLYLTSLPAVDAKDDINQTVKGVAVSGNLLTNDDNLTKVTEVKVGSNVVSVPTSGEATLTITEGVLKVKADGTYTFTPSATFVGSVPPITYTATNAAGTATDKANLIISVTEPATASGNNPPIANYDTGTVKQGQSVTVKSLANDSDPDGDAISVTNIIGRNSTGGALTLTSTPQNVYDANNVLAGQASIVSGELVFTAAATYKGEVPFTYSISDGKGGTSSSTINVTVTSTDTPTIVANDDAKAKPQGQTITGTVKDNDTWSGTNPKVTTATVTIGGTTTTLTPGTQTTISGVGKITLNSDGTYTFIPAPTFVGTVPVTYTVKNDAGVEDTATLYLTSLPAVDAKDDINQTVKGVAVSGNLLTNDDNLTKVTEVKVGSNVVSVPTSGEATLTITEGVLKVKADGTYTFTPSATFVGSVPPITYTATNAAGTATDKANLIISVTEPATASGNNPPIANHDTGTVKQGQSVTVKPLANDSDPDGDAISVTNIIGRNSTGGALTLTSTHQNVYDANNVLAGQASIVSGELVFTAAATYKGEVPFTYSISDGKGGTSSSTINVTVTSTDTPTIVANDDANSALQGVTMIGNVKNNDNWGGTQPKIVEALVVMNGVTYPLVIDASIIIPGVGTITLTKDGPYTFVPVPTFTGTVPVTYTVKNNEGVSDKATLYLTTLPFANPNYWIGTTDTDWNKTSNWTDSRLPLPYTTVEFATTANNNGNPAVNDLHVPIGTPKNVGDLINLSDKSLVVPPAASITVTGTVTGSETADKADKIKINAANDGTTPNGTFIATAACSNFDVYGTVELFAQGQKVSTPAWTDALTGSPTAGDELKSSHSWQHFGVPVEKVMALDAFKKSWIQLYNEKQNGKFQGATKPATFYDKWNFVGAYDDLFAFLGYEITQDVPKVYTIQGKLNFCDKTLNLTREAAEVNGATGVNARYGLGQNIFGNSYTAAINLDNGIEFDNAGLVEKTVYLYRTGSFQDWGANNSTVSTDTPNAGSYIAIPAMVSTTVWGNQIPSMQGFLLKFTDAATEFNPIGASVTLKYNNGGVVANSKPQLAQKAPLSHLTVTLNSKTTVDRVWLFSQEGTTDQFDNGWDGRKYFGTPTAFLYSESSFGPLQVNTSSDLNGKLLTIYPNKDSEYTLTLKKENLADYTDLHLVDLVARKVTPLTGETTTYNFTEKNSGSRVKRFMIVNSANIDFNIDQFKLLDGYLQGNDRLIVTNMTAKTGRAYLYDMAGKTVMSQVMQPSINEFPVTLKSGAYILNLDADGKQESVKLIVK